MAHQLSITRRGGLRLNPSDAHPARTRASNRAMATRKSDDEQRIASELEELRAHFGCSTKIESAEYVVRLPSVAVFSRPNSGVVVGERAQGTVVSTSLRTFGNSPNDGWVRLSEHVSASESGEGWILVDGTLLGLGMQLERRAFERPRQLKWFLAEAQVEIRDAIRGGAIVGHREAGRLLRTDHELSGWMRLTEDFRRARDDGEADVVEGWFSLAANAVSRWWPPGETRGAAPESLPPKTLWYWVSARGGVTVRERPWGGLLTKREHGDLLRGDLLQDGWLRLEEDFVRVGSGMRAKGGQPPEPNAEDEAGRTIWCEEVASSASLLRGWVLVDGRDLGLPYQLQARAGRERGLPRPSIPQAGGGKVFISWDLAEEVAKQSAAKFCRRRSQAESERAEDWSVEAVVRSAGIGDETADVLRRCGVGDLHQLLRVAAQGDANEELKNVGVTRLGARSKMLKALAPYLEAQQAKERANGHYKLGAYAKAVDVYTHALDSLRCHSTLVALNLYNNRAAAYQQMGRPTDALADALFVLRYDAGNSKALARADKARASGAQTAAERADTEAARAEAEAARAEAVAAGAAEASGAESRAEPTNDQPGSGCADADGGETVVS